MGQLGDASPPLTQPPHRPTYHLLFPHLTTTTSCLNYFVERTIDYIHIFVQYCSSRKRVKIDHCRNGDCPRAWNFLISCIGYYKGSLHCGQTYQLEDYGGPRLLSSNSLSKKWNWKFAELLVISMCIV